MILDLVLIGTVIALEPVPLTAFILVLGSQHGAKKGAGFVLGWLLSLATVVAITVLLTGDSPPRPNTAPSVAALVVKLAIGVGLVIVADRQNHSRHRPKKPRKTPKWHARIDGMSFWFAASLAVLLQPWGLIGAGVATIVGAKLTSAGSYLALAGFCLLATSTYIALETYAIVRPARCTELTRRLRGWMESHTDEVIILVSLGLGLWLIGNSLYLLVT